MSAVTAADRLLDRLAALEPAQLAEVVRVAREYGDHPALRGRTGIAAGTRLLTQLQLALGDVTPDDR